MDDDNSTCIPGTIYRTPEFNETLYTLLDAPTEPLEYPAWEIALKVIFYVVAILMDLGGNSIVIMIILLNRKMRTTTNLLILNLAISDLMVGTFCMWVHMGNQISANWPFGAFLCKFSTFSQVISVTASVLTLTVISVERFIAVVFPFRSHWTPTVTGIIIGFTWISAIATASPQLYVRTLNVIEWRDRTEIWCSETWTFYYKNTKCDTWTPRKNIYYLVEGIVMYFVPIIIIIVTYTVIAFKLLLRKPPGSLITSTSSAQEKAKRKVTKMLIVVMTVFIICWTPQQIMLIIDLFEKVEEDYYPAVRYIAVYIAYLNSALNPILYGGFNENFRSGFSEAFRCFLIQKRNKIGPESVMPPWSKKPHSCVDGGSTKLNIISASQFTPYPGQSGHSSEQAHVHNGFLQPPAFQPATTTSHYTEPSREGSEFVHPQNGYLHPGQPAFQRSTTTWHITATTKLETGNVEPEPILALQLPTLETGQESTA